MTDIGNSRPAAQAFELALDKGESRVAEFEVRTRAPLQKLQHFLHANPTAVPAIVLLLSVAAFGSVVGPRFLSMFNLSLIIQQVTIIGVIGAAQTLIVITAGIDLSVGAIMVLCSVIMGKLGVAMGLAAPLALLIGLAVGAGCGAMNGVLVTRFKLPPFIVTLGTWSIFFALNLWYSASETIRSQDVAKFASLLQALGTPVNIFGARFTYGSLFMLALVLAIWFVLNRTAFGRHLYAVGDDPDAARLAGIRTDRILFSVYVIAGVICALGAWALIGRIGSISPQAGQTANLDSITAVVVGGASLFGGRGSIVGTLIGALIVGVFRNGLALSDVDVLWQEFAVGWLIIIAVALDQWIRKVSA
ncbi:ABC transporter permease [Bradyrhizobium jicamae]|uniref:ABC transporter permease n=1 Tax=Bradyrhizobium jicamae TaxID=280332 RepID=A0ABS5FVA1_9BRAD|nr:ABC transporter permease [Bradyrhizobium jicamae]MBR0800663.1 ABC transporter permease [Bradyrhizobium jicamae]MBR0938376.1 ABC transporter permease [Bradyrhizobium jicamae]